METEKDAMQRYTMLMLNGNLKKTPTKQTAKVNDQSIAANFLKPQNNSFNKTSQNSRYSARNINPCI